jgi:CRISPR type IV-associated protein Csf3
MEPLMITAEISGGICMPYNPLAIDALLAHSVVLRDHITPCSNPDEVVKIEIPLKREPEGRFHLCSHAVFVVESRENRYKNKRPVIAEAQNMGKSIKSIQINAGHSKGFRIPYEVFYLSGDEIRWWAIGDVDKVSDLLEFVTHIGKYRNVGLGKVRNWSVEPCEPWGDGFPVVLDGKPLRPLPEDWPGLSGDVRKELSTITYPYPRTLNPKLYVCAMPEVAI